jgi:hypothetical protein
MRMQCMYLRPGVSSGPVIAVLLSLYYFADIKHMFICHGLGTLMHMYICVTFFFLFFIFLFLFRDIILFLMCLYHILMKLDLYHFI